MLNFIKKIIPKPTEEDLLVKKLIETEIQRPSYFMKSETKRVLGNLEEHTQRNGSRFYKLNKKVIILNLKNNKKIYKAMNSTFWAIENQMEVIG